MNQPMMEAIACAAPGDLQRVSRPVPRPGPGDVLIRIQRIGICGTDFHIFQGKHPFLTYPRIIGHELSGEIVANGAATDRRLGERVTIIPYMACGQCIACRRQRPNCCQRLQVLGVHCDGGLCEFLAVPEANALAADDLSIEQAAMVEFLAIGAHGIGRAEPGPKDRVLIVGAGPIGLAAMIFAKLRGADVTAIDVRTQRLRFCAERLGVGTLPAGAAVDQALAELTGGDFFDLVVDATGNRLAMEKGLAYVAHGGTYLLLGVNAETLSFADPELHKRETSLLASRNATRADFLAVIAAMHGGLVPCDALATHHARLDEIPTLLPQWLDPEARVIKAIVEVTRPT
jgi:2-desacetyl-2-hydroxyethyl bacteriochlorophyllide A dehydrogenase